MSCKNCADHRNDRQCIYCNTRDQEVRHVSGQPKLPALAGFYWARSDKHRSIYDQIVYAGTERNKGYQVINVILGTINYYDSMPANIVIGPSIDYPKVPEVAS